MPELARAAAGAVLVTGVGGAVGTDLNQECNESPSFASVTNFPTSRFETDPNGIYMTTRREFLSGGMTVRPLTLGESLDILPPALALTYELAVALGREVTNLIPDESPEIDIGSAL